MSITTETWKKALHCAHSQYERYVQQGKVTTAEERLCALNDALQHAVGIISLRDKRPDAECGCPAEQSK